MTDKHPWTSSAPPRSMSARKLTSGRRSCWWSEKRCVAELDARLLRAGRAPPGQQRPCRLAMRLGSAGFHLRSWEMWRGWEGSKSPWRAAWSASASSRADPRSSAVSSMMSAINTNSLAACGRQAGWGEGGGFTPKTQGARTTTHPSGSAKQTHPRSGQYGFAASTGRCPAAASREAAAATASGPGM